MLQELLIKIFTLCNTQSFYNLIQVSKQFKNIIETQFDHKPIVCFHFSTIESSYNIDFIKINKITYIDYLIFKYSELRSSFSINLNYPYELNITMKKLTDIDYQKLHCKSIDLFDWSTISIYPINFNPGNDIKTFPIKFFIEAFNSIDMLVCKNLAYFYRIRRVLKYIIKHSPINILNYIDFPCYLSVSMFVKHLIKNFERETIEFHIRNAAHKFKDEETNIHENYSAIKELIEWL